MAEIDGIFFDEEPDTVIFDIGLDEEKKRVVKFTSFADLAKLKESNEKEDTEHKET